MRKIILADAKTVGSLDWELAEHTSQVLDSLPEDLAQLYLTIIKEDLLLHLALLLEAFRRDVEESGSNMPRLDYIEGKHADVARYLGITT